MKRTYVYIDGFNLYYGALKRTHYKWLDISKLLSKLLTGNEIIKIKYFTALVSGTEKQQRQKTYNRALRTIPNFEIHYGHFLSHVVRMPSANEPGKYCNVIKTEEKGSDVNIASHILIDGFKNLYDTAVIVSNDSDLYEPMRYIKQELGKRIGIINPQKGKTSKKLLPLANFIKTIRSSNLLTECQFAFTLEDQQGKIEKPDNW